jgi:hypothetical protein
MVHYSFPSFTTFGFQITYVELLINKFNIITNLLQSPIKWEQRQCSTLLEAGVFWSGEFLLNVLRDGFDVFKRWINNTARRPSNIGLGFTI